jgi:hypothetical protein
MGQNPKLKSTIIQIQAQQLNSWIWITFMLSTYWNIQTLFWGIKSSLKAWHNEWNTVIPRWFGEFYYTTLTHTKDMSESCHMSLTSDLEPNRANTSILNQGSNGSKNLWLEWTKHLTIDQAWFLKHFMFMDLSIPSLAPKKVPDSGVLWIVEESKFECLPFKEPRLDYLSIGWIWQSTLT